MGSFIVYGPDTRVHGCIVPLRTLAREICAPCITSANLCIVPLRTLFCKKGRYSIYGPHCTVKSVIRYLPKHILGSIMLNIILCLPTLTYTHSHVRTHTPLCKHSCVHMHMLLCIHSCAHMRIRTHTWMHAQCANGHGMVTLP